MKVRSRWQKSLSPNDYRVTRNDERHMRLLDPWNGYDLLPTNWIAPFTPDLHSEWVRHRLRVLWDAFGYLDRRTLGGGKDNSAIFNYSLSEAGARHLELSQPYKRKGEWDKHAAMGSVIMASIELGIRQAPAMGLMKARDILTHSLTPDHTKSSDTPFIFEVEGTKVIPDGKPFVIGRKSDRKSCLFLREDDRNTETLSTIARKFELYNVIWKNKLYLEKYNHQSAFLLFPTINEIHKQNMMDVAAQVIGPCSWILFKAAPEFADLYATIPVTTRLFDEPWERVGHPPFSLKELAPSV